MEYPDEGRWSSARNEEARRSIERRSRMLAEQGVAPGVKPTPAPKQPRRIDWGAAFSKLLIAAVIVPPLFIFGSCLVAMNSAPSAEEVAANREWWGGIGFKPEPSPWDGVAPEVLEYWKATLHDVDSAKVATAYEVVRLRDGYYQRLRFRAKNLLGAYVLKDETYKIVNSRVVQVIDNASDGSDNLGNTTRHETHEDLMRRHADALMAPMNQPVGR